MVMNAFIYCFKVWFTTLVVATFILGIISGTEPFSFMLFGVFIGGGLAVPGLFLLWLSAIGLAYYRLSQKLFKYWLSLIAAILCILQMIAGAWSSGNTANMYLCLPFIAVSAFCIWYYKAKFIKATA
ncbi:4-amino-4-deoxy-L-arabinose transferase-like glycosyltransferase [Mucilaginibacter terrae]|uniref:4-amino-4-deoxy-L-arabinose transferase-like glycosyltransferase n=1 Tax=Mucilaginibacter terrae TaxID=1955052 RepID=A0ABU3GX78_9SPHI|nr:4-amino-4-deoxy-L-arabinose transferase-like glycosyltransferase [Mucilaginibacter terrae]